MLVITVGGLGFSQMGTVREAIQKQCPQADVKSGGMWDAFKNDIAKMIQENPRDHVVLVGHSLGCQTITQAAGQFPNVDLLVFIEPAGDDIRVPASVKRTLWFQRSNWDLLVGRAKVSGLSPTRINGGHNEVAHSPELAAQVVKAINGIQTRRRK